MLEWLEIFAHRVTSGGFQPATLQVHSLSSTPTPPLRSLLLLYARVCAELTYSLTKAGESLHADLRCSVPL